MSGPNPQTRSVTRERGVGRCKECGGEALGTTTVERRPWGDATEHTYHFCDGCLAAAPERPLEVVIGEFAAP